MQLIVGIVFLLGGAWEILQMTTSSVREDVGIIRAAVQTLQTADKDGSRRVSDTELRPSNELGLLRTSIVSLDGKITAFDAKLDGLNKSILVLTSQIGDMQKQIASRQAAWSDPKAAEAFKASLKNLGLDNQKIPYSSRGTGLVSRLTAITAYLFVSNHAADWFLIHQRLRALCRAGHVVDFLSALNHLHVVAATDPPLAHDELNGAGSVRRFPLFDQLNDIANLPEPSSDTPAAIAGVILSV